jgi:hypothetical protein
MADDKALRALVTKWRKPYAGARQQANTNADFASIRHSENVRGACADELEAALNAKNKGRTNG